MQRRRYYALFGFVAVIAAAGIAAYLGVLPGTAPKAPEPSVAAVPSAAPEAEAPKAEAQNAENPQAENPQTETPQGETPQIMPPAAEKAGVAAPSFDVLRVEPDGSVVIAGKAAPAASVDVLAGSTVVGSAKAAANGDFAVALDRALKPGDHQLVLRATGADSKAATSEQTAIVSVPEKEDGQVLALVEEPGQASRMITTPQAAAPSAAPAQSPAVPPSVSAAAAAPAADPQKQEPITVEAVEIEGNTIFVAGKGVPGKQVAIYANDALLGKAQVEPTSRFLVQSHHQLAVGDYIIRADLLEKDGTVIASASVPFRREPGENLSAIASPAGNAVNVQPALVTERSVDTASNATMAKPLESAAGSVIIRKGDNLWTISKRTYGRGIRYTTIYLANADRIRNPNLIWPGQVFSMPKEPLVDEEAQRQLKARN
ncbi:Ig-like domain-containing protein [Phyllobacterium leguminum]|uniref:Nucleoid-associated protein YgaU n=1 Tax=Phyllobacterium leguminum TaxID=314237 RepID=A0A318T3D8_9HYPH|nr:Ig-like domain-containing protein [Phyllobacterium leguminum]PYE88502.1 nucleoid-associated protein YgaU [Phyllobacterium leguminum]